MKTARMSPIEVRKALKELLDAALTRADAGSIAPRPHPSETMFMLMLVHLQNKVNENDHFESMVNIPRMKVGERQTIETLINEEALLFARYLRIYAVLGPLDQLRRKPAIFARDPVRSLKNNGDIYCQENGHERFCYRFSAIASSDVCYDCPFWWGSERSAPKLCVVLDL